MLAYTQLLDRKARNEMNSGIATTILIPLLSAVAGAGGAIIAALISFQVQQKKLSREIDFQRDKLNQEVQIQRERLQTEFATEESVEVAIRQFLEMSELQYRSFQMIRHYIGGFEPNELRRLLVRAGSVRFIAADGSELWALRERVADDFRVGNWRHKQSPQNKVSENELFPGAFNDLNQY